MILLPHVKDKQDFNRDFCGSFDITIRLLAAFMTSFSLVFLLVMKNNIVFAKYLLSGIIDSCLSDTMIRSLITSLHTLARGGGSI